MNALNNILDAISGFLWGWPMIIMLLGTHLFLTVRLRFPQRHIFKAIKLSVRKDKGAEGDVSQFGALVTALAATIGTGNIVGVGTAIALGGPGAVFWCWLTGVFGIATKYGEGLLAIKYRVTDEDGKMQGGPMYALERGLGLKWMGVLFALFTAVASFGIGSTVQANAISTMTHNVFGIDPVVIGGIITILASMVIVGGVKNIAKVCTALVPLMALLYVLGCITILFMNSAYVGPAVKLIVSSAFNPSAIGGGMAGGGLMMAARYGIARGLFSNESGLGSAPIVAAAAQTRNPVRQALVSSTGTFWDTVVICAITGIVIVSSILAFPDISFENGGVLTTMAFSKIPYIGSPLLAFGSLTFAFSTILGWSYYGERAVEYMAAKTKIREKVGMKAFINTYRALFLITVYLGAVVSLDLVWNLADIFNALMAIPNLIALILLSGVIVKETRKYLWDGDIDKD
ncbi:MAG: sodium:alanine symporter family protein [Bacteroidales bacterium]|nr:sodium:alanine symporter family protein [Bacteroidales bacterium]